MRFGKELGSWPGQFISRRQSCHRNAQELLALRGQLERPVNGDAWGVLKCEVQLYFLFISPGFVSKGEEKMGPSDLMKINKYIKHPCTGVHLTSRGVWPSLTWTVRAHSASHWLLSPARETADDGLLFCCGF